MDVDAAGQLLQTEVAEVRRFDSAGISSVYAVTTVAGDRLILKCAPEEWHWTLDKETHVYELLHERRVDVPVPRVLGRPADGVLLLELLPGESTSSVETTSLYRQIGAVLAKLHAVELDAFGYLGTSGIAEAHETNLDYMLVQFEKKLGEYAELGGDESIRTRVAAYVREREELFVGCGAPALCHNDCHEGNLLATGGRISGIFDFQNVVGGDPLLDLAKAACYSGRDRAVVVESLADGYGGLRHDWREALDRYVLYHRLELWDWFASLGERNDLAALADGMRATVA